MIKIAVENVTLPIYTDQLPAHQVTYGAGWRIPTKTEFENLLNGTACDSPSMCFTMFGLVNDIYWSSSSMDYAYGD